jgi:hypothetical protein
MKLVSNLILGLMASTAIIGLIIIVGAMIMGEMNYAQFGSISFSGE